MTTTTFDHILTNLMSGLPLALALMEGMEERENAPLLITRERLEEKVTQLVERSNWRKADYLPNAKKVFEAFYGLTFEEMVEKDADSVLLMAEAIMKKVSTKVAQARLKMSQSLDNRGYYLWNYVMSAQVSKDGGINWRFKAELLPKGLLHCYLDYRGLSPVHGIPSMQIRNELFEIKDGAKLKKPIPRELWAVWRNAGMLPTKSNLAWWDDGDVIDLLTKAFPDAINFQAYCQRLAAPLLPGGHHPNIKVIFAKGRVGENGEVLFPWNEGYEKGVPDQCDGAHYYSRDRILTGEHKSIQFSLINAQGMFSKGIAEPVSGDIIGDYDIVIDYEQVKGSHKGIFKSGDTCIADLGIMRRYNGGQYPLNFEQLQFMNPDNHEGGRRGFIQDVRSVIEKNAQLLFQGGREGAVAAVAKVMPNISMLRRITNVIAPDFDLLQMKIVQGAVQEHYRSSLWNLATGAGFYGRQMEVKIDGSLKRGECVCNITPGKEVAVWRMPCVLPQGLLTLKTVEPGKRPLPPGRIYVSPFDTKAMQADDDGDIVGVTTNQAIVRLFKSRITEKVFLIEPKGEKMKFDVKSELGLKYLEIDPRGPVGKTTLWQTALLNQPDRSEDGKAFWWALAMAMINQYAIDMAKKVVKWPDPDHLSNPNSWKLNDDGFYELKTMVHLPGQVDGINEFPMETYQKWVEDKYERLGIWVRVNGQLSQGELITYSVYPWRSQKDSQGQRLNKRIDIANFKPTHEISKRQLQGNVVQGVYNMAQQIVSQLIDLNKFSEELNRPEKGSLELRDALLNHLKEKGIQYRILAKDWQEYEAIRKNIGLTEAGKAWSKLKAEPEDDEEESDKKERMEQIQNDLECWLRIASLDELLTSWYWELTPTWRNPNRRQETSNIEQDDWWRINNTSNAMRVVSFPGSPILALLGVEDEGQCPFGLKLLAAKEQIATKLLQADNVWSNLSHVIYTNTTHGDMVKNESGRVEWSCCEQCKKIVAGILLTAYREREKKGHGGAAKVLTKKLNDNTPKMVIFQAQEEDGM